MKISYKLFAFIGVMFLGACGSPGVKPNLKGQLIDAIVLGQQQAAELLMQEVNIGVHRRNLILQYFYMLNDKSLPLIQSLEVTNNMIEEVNQEEFLKIHRALNTWAFMHEIYRVEVSRDIRILQREQLYLAPSEVNFEKCQTQVNESCAQRSREQLYHFMNQAQVIQQLKSMAEKDPCINLTSGLEGADKANACLKKRMGELQVTLLKKPKFSPEDWRNLLR